jgi:23S rRNA (uridine2552-2'-O)-methyltransferase
VKRQAKTRDWHHRHVNDFYVQQATAQGWRSRAAFKLMEIDDRDRLIKPGQVVVDLGCAPGGWCQVAALRMKQQGMVIGRSEERRVGKECRRLCRSRWSPYH